MEEKVCKILSDVNEDILTYSGNNMYDEGIVSSMEVLDIVSQIEELFDIEIDAEDIIAKNFSCKEAIIELVKKYTN